MNPNTQNPMMANPNMIVENSSGESTSGDFYFDKDEMKYMQKILEQDRNQIIDKRQIIKYLFILTQ